MGLCDQLEAALVEQLQEHLGHRRSAWAALEDVVYCVDMGGTGEDTQIGVLIGLSAGAVIALCSVLVAWFKWRHPNKDG